MFVKARIASAFVFCIILSGLLITSQAAGEEWFYGQGWGGIYVTLKNDGQLQYNISGSPFNSYVVTEPNWDRILENQSFGYIAHLSVENVTHVDIKGDLPEGKYVIAVFIIQNGSVEFSYSVTYPEPPNRIPAVVVLLIIAVAVIAVLLVLLGSHRRR